MVGVTSLLLEMVHVSTFMKVQIVVGFSIITAFFFIFCFVKLHENVRSHIPPCGFACLHLEENFSSQKSHDISSLWLSESEYATENFSSQKSHDISSLWLSESENAESGGKLVIGYFMNTPGSMGAIREASMYRVFNESLPFLNLLKVSTIPLTDPRIFSDSILSNRQVQSNLYSHVLMWNLFSESNFTDDSWALFLEDDVEFHPEVRGRPDLIYSIISEVVHLAHEVGFAYLGLCQPDFLPGDDQWVNQHCDRSKLPVVKSTKNNIMYVVGCGHCAHAYVMTKWRSKIMWNTLMSRNLTYPSFCDRELLFPGRHRLSDNIQRLFMDVHLYCWSVEISELHGAWLAGANLSSSIPGHVGIMYQERSIGQSIQY